MLIDFDSNRACAEPSAPPSRSFVLAALRALHLDTGVGSALSTSRSKQLKTPLTTPRPFRDDNWWTGLESALRYAAFTVICCEYGYRTPRRVVVASRHPVGIGKCAPAASSPDMSTTSSATASTG